MPSPNMVIRAVSRNVNEVAAGVLSRSPEPLRALAAFLRGPDSTMKMDDNELRDFLRDAVNLWYTNLKRL